MTASMANINRTAIMMIAVSKVIKMNITTINIMTREEPMAAMARTAMGAFHSDCIHSAIY